MRVMLIRRDKSIEMHKAKAGNIVIDNFLYTYDADSVLHQSRGFDKRLICYVEHRTEPVNFYKLESLTADDAQRLQLIAHDLARVRAHDEFKELKRTDNMVVWVLVVVIAIMAVMQIIGMVV